MDVGAKLTSLRLLTACDGLTNRFYVSMQGSFCGRFFHAFIIRFVIENRKKAMLRWPRCCFDYHFES